MMLNDWIYSKILPSLSRACITMLSGSLRIQSKGEKYIKEVNKEKRPIVFVFWHGRQFIFVNYMAHKNICIMSSTSRDGILQANILKKFGYEIIYGSSAKSPVRALVGSIKKIRMGFNVAFAVDGPTGPIHKVKPGALFLAKKTNGVIIPGTFFAFPAITLGAWDKYLLPLPFSRAIILFGKPFYPLPSLNDNIIEKECVYIEEMLNEMTAKADAFFKKHRPISHTL
jgi:lysophospholipid acyltransferase (LPLAT)-like uncharacterized protein